MERAQEINNCSIKSKLSPATPHPHGINKIEDYRLKESIEGRAISDAAHSSMQYEPERSS